MNSRRSFIKKIGTGAALSTVAFSSTSLFASQPDPLAGKVQSNNQKPIRVGIIGAENSHTATYAKLFNIDKKFPGVELTHVWAESWVKPEEIAKVMEKGKIPNLVKDPSEMLGKIDALIVDHRDAKYHLEPAIPFIKAKIPTFIDKPFCYRVSEGKEFLALARSLGTPVSSFSNNAYSDENFDIKKQVAEIGKISRVVSFSPVDIESKWGGVFFYGVHAVEQLLSLFGEDVTKVRVSRTGSNATASLIWGNGLLATMVYLKAYKFAMYIETRDGVVELNSRIKEPDPERGYTDIVEMFRTGKEPRTHQSILYGMAVLEAIEKSISSDNWENVIVPG
jgi:hypothetical protein